ncbi:MAG: hypothetical protein KC419_23580, partial [Anaerolineales bacterium]|nr:hypothetical protein [Anaerolineales bacterium]
VPGSLRAKPNGFAFTLQNVIESGSLVVFRSLRIDGDKVDPARIVLVSMHGVERRATAVSPSTPLYFPVNTTIRVQVNGRMLTPGQHTIQVRWQLQEIPGILEVQVTDFLATED